jgi:hypothetical protein
MRCRGLARRCSADSPIAPASWSAGAIGDPCSARPNRRSRTPAESPADRDFPLPQSHLRGVFRFGGRAVLLLVWHIAQDFPQSISRFFSHAQVAYQLSPVHRCYPPNNPQACAQVRQMRSLPPPRLSQGQPTRQARPAHQAGQVSPPGRPGQPTRQASSNEKGKAPACMRCRGLAWRCSADSPIAPASWPAGAIGDPCSVRPTAGPRHPPESRSPGPPTVPKSPSGDLRFRW